MRLVNFFILSFLITNAMTTMAEDVIEFNSADDKQRYETLLEELRCLVCQNQNLADSDAGLAVDLKNEVLARVNDGQSNEQIKSFLTLRYGDFILYEPPMSARTFFLWAGPFLLLFIAMLFLFLRLRKQTTTTNTANHLDASEAEALQALLAKHQNDSLDNEKH